MTVSKEKTTKKSLQESFNEGQRVSKAPAKRKRLPPLSVRVTEEERLQLKQDAAGMPLNAYIRGCLFGSRKKRRKPSIQDYQALAQVLSALGQSYIAGSLAIIADEVAQGRLTLTDEEREQLLKASEDIGFIRSTLIVALGLKAE